MKFKFIGNPHNERDRKASVVNYGITFDLGVPVEVDDPFVIGKLSGNCHFEAVGEESVPAEAEAKPRKQKKQG